MTVLIAPQARTIYLVGTTLYYSDEKARITVTVAADQLALEKQGCRTAPTDGLASSVTVALAAGAANAMLITVTAVDPDGNTVAGVHRLELWFSASATTGALTSTAYSGSLVASTGSLMTTLTAKKHFTVLTDVNGVFAGSLTDTGKPATEYVYVRRPIGAAPVISAASGTTWG